MTIEPAASYFRRRSVPSARSPLIIEAYSPSGGWEAQWPRLVLTAQRVRTLRSRGFTDVSLRAGAVTADFRLGEFWSEQVGLGQWKSET